MAPVMAAMVSAFTNPDSFGPVQDQEHHIVGIGTGAGQFAIGPVMIETVDVAYLAGDASYRHAKGLCSVWPGPRR